jgi:Flp pilus assembly protein TadB
MAFCGEEVPAPMREAFAVVVGARDAGIRLVQEAAAAGRTLRGFEVAVAEVNLIRPGVLASLLGKGEARTQ